MCSGLAEDANLVPAPTLDSTNACDFNSDACWVTALSEEKSKTGHSTAVVEDMGEEISLHKDVNTQTQHNCQGSETDLPADISGRSINFKYGGKSFCKYLGGRKTVLFL